MNRKIYKEIARKHGVSIGEVRRDIQAAIDEAYKTPNFYTRCIYCEGDKPTPEEFIAHIARRVEAGES
jgi:hypothetical protein